jgi:hypothetical protein
MNINKLQLINCICHNGYKETINSIIHIPPKIVNEYAGAFIVSNGSIQLARIMQFIRKEDGTIIKIK